jgi:hypothetical protein
MPRLSAVVGIVGLWLAVTSLRADTITGQVLEDHSGAALAFVEVRVARDGVRELAADLDTDSQGRFRAADLTPGEYRLEFVKVNYVSATVRVRAGGAPRLVRLTRLGILSGRVTDAVGSPIAGAGVLVTRYPALVDFKINGDYRRTDDRGEYRISDLAPGRYTVGIAYSAPGAGSGVRVYPENTNPRMFEVTGGEEFRNIDFVVLPTSLYSVEGSVKPPGRAYAVALAALDQPYIPTAVLMATSPDGKFRFAGVPSGIYHLFASGPATPYMQSASMLGISPVFARTQVSLFQDAKDIELTSQPGRSITVVVRANLARTKPCADTAQLKLTPLEAWGAVVERTVQLSVGKEQALNNLAPGRYRISLSNLGSGCYSVADRALDLSGGADDAPVSMEIAPFGSVQGRLTGGGDLSRFAVVLIPSDPALRSEPIRFAYAEVNGLFRLDTVRPGRYRAAVCLAAGTARAAWISKLAAMPEIDIPGGPPTELDLPAPAAAREE